MGDDRTKINATAVLRDIAREEAALKDFETRARAGGQGRKGGSGEDGALAQQIYDSRCILEALYEDVILSDPHTADMRGIEDRLWTVVFYARVDELRAVIKSKRSNPTTATLLLHDHIAHASAFYQLLIHSVRTRAAIQGDMHSLVRAAVDRFVRDLPAQTQTASASTIAIAIAQPASSLPASTPSPPHQHIMAVASRQQRHPHDLALDTIHRSLIYLGDLARYRLLTPLPSPGPGAPAAPTPLADRDWYVPRALYRRALLVKPGSAKACAQLAIVAGYGGVDWDVAYWNAVGATMPHAPTQARDNLKAFYLNNGQRLIDLSNGEMSEDGAVSRLLNVHRALVYYNLTPAEEIRLLHDSASPALDHLVLTTTPDTVYDRAMALKKVLVPLLLAVGELSARFKVETQVSIKQTIRNLESMTVCLIFRALELCMHVVSSFPSLLAALEGSLDLEGPDAMAVDGNEVAENSAAMLEMLVPVSVVSTWMMAEGNAETVQAAQGYTGWVGEAGKDGGLVAKCRISFFKSLAALLNSFPVTYLAPEMDDRVPEDVDFLGSGQFLSYYAKGSSESLTRILVEDGTIPEGASRDNLERRLVRIQAMASRLCAEEKYELKYDTQEHKLVVLDEDARRQVFAKLSRRLATEYLRNQVDELEREIAKEPVLAVVATDVFVSHLPRVRRWMANKKMVVVLSTSVIDDLDLLKKGSEKKNATAREAIRLIEQRLVLLQSGHPWAGMRAQKPEETAALEWKFPLGQPYTTVDGEQVKVVPRRYRGALGCTAWFIANYGSSGSLREHSKGLRVALVTDDVDLAHFANGLALSNTSTLDFEKELMQS